MPSDVVSPRFASLYSSKTVTFVLLVLAVCAVSAPADGGPGASTTTALTVSSGTVVAGTPVTLTATVTENSKGSMFPVTQGTVLFCDADAVRCADSAIIGSAQLTAAGSTTIKLTLGAGTHSISAAFQGKSAPPSVSAPQLLAVDGNASYLSFSDIASSGTPGNYTLTGAVAAFGKNVPTGTVSFLDTDSGDAVVGTAALDPTTLGFVLVPAEESPATVGSRPQNTVLGDFNNDGRLDLAATNGSANTVSVLLGNGDGTFQLQTAYAAGASPIALASGDFNGDGNLDLVAGNAGAATISVYLGNGDGTFLPQQIYAAGNGPQSIAVADFDGDGVLDLAVVDRNDQNVTILLGQGDGTFQVEQQVCGIPPCAPLTFPVGEASQVIATADFNGDGVADLAVTDSQTSQVDVLLGVGDGTFQSQVTYAVRFNPIGLAIADFNKDGILDLAVANAESNSISVLMGVGDGTFQTQVAYGTGGAPEGLSVGDFNGDGNMDLVVSNNGSKTVSVLLGKGDGTFKTQLVFSAGNRPFGIGVGDLNGDGLPDVVVANSSASSMSILLSAQTETATATGQAVFGTGSHEVLASYPGDSDRAASESVTVLLDTIPQTVTATTLVAAPGTAFAGQPVTLTATVEPAPTGTPAGAVSFFNGATLLGTGTVDSSGMASFTSSSLPTGSLSLTAVYTGNTRNVGSTSALQTVTVNPQTVTTTALLAAPSPAIFGQPVTLTAAVAPAPAGTPAGTVSFFNGSTLLGTAIVNSSGVASFVTTSLASGTDSITAVYSGNAGFATSTSSALAVMVTAASTFAVTAPQTPFTVVAGGSVDVNITVPPIGGSYDSVVTMSASGLPAGATDTFAPPTVTPGASGAGTVMTIQTAAKAASLPARHQQQFPFASIILAAGLCLVTSRRKRFTRAMRVLLAVVALVGGTLMLTACNGGFAGSSSAQSFVITVTGTSGSQHISTTVTLIVK